MNLPNRLTICRFFIAAIISLFFLTDIFEPPYKDYITTATFLLGSLTDFLDGYIARKWDMITTFGIFADPIADKVLIMSAMVSLVFMHRLSPFVAIALIGRDIIMTGFRLIAMEKGVIIPALISGKIKTVSESLLIGFLLLNLNIEIISILLIIISIILAYFSLIKVIIINYKVFINTI